MKALVIGGTQFIGRLLVKDLLKAGHQVAVLHRQPKHDLGRRVENIQADRNDQEAVRRALAGRNFELIFDNVYDWQRGTTASQVEAAALACGDKLARYVFMSSVAAYGDGLDHREADPLAPDFHSDPYVRNKAGTERMLFRLHRNTGFPVTTFRPPYIYGPDNPFYRETFFWDRMRAGRPIIVPGDGRRLMQFVHVRDLVQACVRCTEVPRAVGEAFNIGNSKPITQVELVKLLGKVAGKDPEIVRVSRDRIMEAGGNPLGDPLYFGEALDLPPITEKMGKVQRMLGVKITPFETGLAETYRWHVRNQKRGKVDFSFEDRLMAMPGNRTYA